MKADFSRLSFDRRKHYAGVLQQQGRVGTDSDWNEWVEIVLRRLAVETRDVIGNCGRPKHHPGFKISVDSSVNPPELLISDGRLYAGGLLAESESPKHKGTKFSKQTDWPFPDQTSWTNLFPTSPAWPGLDLSSIAKKGTLNQLVYAEVWLRHLTALNDEAARDQAYHDAGGNPDWTTRPEVGDLIRERALGGPDTCTRLQTVAQVKLWNYTDSKIQTCDEACAALAKALPPRTIGTMQLDVTPTPPVTDPCQEPMQGGYGGAWNRMYRVEIHDDGAAGTATFKWSNENAAFTTRIQATALTSVAAGNDIVVTSIGNDQETQLSANDWVEVCGEETELGLFRNALAQVKSTPVANTDGTWTIQLTGAVVMPRAPFLRRWSAGTQTVQLNQQFNLDAGSGLGVTFFDSDGSTTGTTYFHAQDYWTWSARVDIRAVEPQTLAQVPQPAQGIDRHYCCLALLTWQNQNGNVVSTANTPCTPEFPPLTELPTGECGCCCVISVGDGVLSHGDYDSLSEAFASLPNTAQRGAIAVCVQEGVHRIDQPIHLTQDRVIIRGCGPNTFIEAPAGAFVLEARRQVVFTDLILESEKSVIVARDVHEVTIRDSKIRMSLSKPASARTATAPAPPASSTAAGRPAPPSGARVIADTTAAPEVTNRATETHAALPVEMRVNVTVQQRTQPALVLQGWMIDVLRNEIRGSVDGGGIAILPASAEVRIIDNNIHRSALPGVDFSYALASSKSEWFPIQMGRSATAFESIRIAGNTFTDINAPAIYQDVRLKGINYDFSLPLLKRKKTTNALALENPAALVLADLSIVENLITNCGLASSSELPGEGEAAQKNAAKVAAARLSRSPSPDAAIQFYSVSRLDVSNNQILRNGQRSPVFAAILIELAEAAVFRHNTISENGRLEKISNANAGGVILHLAMPDIPLRGRELVSADFGRPALIVEDNLIESLNGPALKVTGLGSMQISRNVLTNHRASNAVFTSCLIVNNAGSTAESLVPDRISRRSSYVSTGVNLLGPSVLSRFGGLTQIAENQIISQSDVECTGFAALVSSADDLSFTNNQVRVNTTVEMVTSVHAHAYTLRVLGNRFSEPAKNTLTSCRGNGAMVTATSNQATHCLLFSATDGSAVSLNLVSPGFSEQCKALSEKLLNPDTGSRDLAEPLKQLADVQQQVDTFQSSLLDQAHTALADRADSLTAMSKALPDLTDRAELYSSISAPLKDVQAAVKGVPKPVSGSFVLHGRVLTKQGQPRAGVAVAVSDPKGVVNNRITPVKTDDNGYFTITLRAAEFPDLAAGSQLFVSVSDARQREIAKPQQPAVFQPDTVAVMPIAG